MDKSIEAAIQAQVNYWSENAPENCGEGKLVEFFAMRAAIEAYRDPEIADLCAKLKTCEDLRDSLYSDLADLRAKLESAERDAGRECLWVDDDDCGVWEGSCGVAWTFIDAGPAENGMKHCPQCGGHLTLDEAAARG